MNKRSVKRPFTLLELLIVLMILASIGSLTVINIRKMFQEQQALNEMSSVVHLLNRAVDLMTLVDLDSEVRFSKKKDRLHVELIPKSGVSALVLPLISASPLILENVQDISFRDGIQETELTDNFSLFFFSKGFLMNRGVLKLNSPQALASVLLYGYPAPLSLIKGNIQYPDEKPFQDLIQKMAEQIRLET